MSRKNGKQRPSKKTKPSRREIRRSQFQQLECDNYETTEYRPKREKEPLRAKNEIQGQLISTTITKDIVFVTGPAGTGKTYIPTALAAEFLSENKIEKLIIVRPMQECGEKIGFLPGELDDKYEPWVEPIIDVLNERLGKSHVKNLLRNNRIEAKPLSFMRGKSFNDAWVILDEAQNTTPEQMKMFLTRIGQNSKLIISGDIKQTDLKSYKGEIIESGLFRAINNLKDIPQVGFVEFGKEDIVRNDVIREIIDRF